MKIRRPDSSGARLEPSPPLKVLQTSATRQAIADAIKDLSNPSSDLLTKAVARQYLKIHGIKYGVAEVPHAK